MNKPVKKTEKIKESLNNVEKNSYTAKDIYVLEGLEPVRRRPGMYIGSTGVDGLHHLIWEVVDNCIDEAMGGYAKNINVEILKENRVAITDDGRGIPVDIHKKTKKSALETVMCTLHAGGKFGGTSYKVAGGLHGVGISVVNALSTYLQAEICRDGILYSQEYNKGKPTTKLKKIGKCNQSGTKIIFEPDPEIFKEIKFDTKKILDHLRQQAYLTSGTTIKFKDHREGALIPSYVFYFESGIITLVKYLARDTHCLTNNVFYTKQEKEGILVEVALLYTDDSESTEKAFANNIHTPEGGMHLTGFRSALTRTLNDYAKGQGIFKNGDIGFTGEDTREGLVVVISVKLREPQFEGQTKAKLGNPEARTAVEQVVGENFKEFLEANKEDAKRILEKSLLSARARQAAKKARENILRKGVLEGMTLPGKLADCISKNAEESELFIVEGDSAGGCFFGDTKIALLDGRDISFKQLVKEYKQGKRNYCYTIKKDGCMGVSLIENPRKTKTNVSVIKVSLDNNEEIICTPDHKFMLKDGSYKEAKDLIPEDSLMPLYRKYSEMGHGITIDGYEMVFDSIKNKWIFTHLLSDIYNIQNDIYLKDDGCDKHHIDFNKLNNNPDNITRMEKESHMAYHREMAKYGIHSEASKEKARQAHKSIGYREKIRKIMSTPEMKKMLSERAKKQWQNEEYKNYMAQKFSEFYNSNAKYREENKKNLNLAQKKYWADWQNREKQSKRVKQYFENHPEKKKVYSELAKKQWDNLDLRNWRSDMTKKQWTEEFRKKRRISYNKTYVRKCLEVLHEIYQRDHKIDKDAYCLIRKNVNDKSLIKYDTICQRFFEGDEKKLQEAVVNYNHRIKSIIRLKKKVDVYDIEVAGTHNFALASGVFVHNSSKMGRNRNTQAILPLKGKILNVEKSRFDRMMTSEEIKALIVALGTAISEDFDINKLRYHKVVIMTDADSVAYDTPIFVFDKQQQRLKLVKTGEFIENQCQDTERYQVFACDLDKKTFSLRDIEKTIRHPLRGSLYEIKTRYGYKMKITSCHNVFIYRSGNFITVPTTELKVGDKIIFPASMPQLNQKVKIDISPLLKHSEETKNIQIKVLASKMKFIPNNAWIDFSSKYWQKLQLRRQEKGISRRRLGAAIGVYTTVLEQWELKIDNVMPRYKIFKEYLSELDLEERKVLKNASAYIPLSSFVETGDAVEYYFKNHTRKLKVTFDINEDFAYLLGFYIGDGYFAYQKKNPNRFILSLGKDKKLYSPELMKAIDNVLGVTAFIDKRNDNNNELVFHSYEFKLILQSFGLLGKKSYEKFVPEEIFSVNPKIQEAFLRGYLESDGSIVVKSCKEKLDVKLTFTTASEKLSDGVVLLFRQLGIFPESTMRFSKDHLRKDGVMIKSNYRGRLISVKGISQLEKLKDVWKNHKRSKTLENYLARADKRKSSYKKIRIGDSVLLPITSIKKIKAKTPFVYDFAVKKDENFVAGTGGFLLHNTDGAHITSLLLTLFFRYFRPIIDAGYLYIAQPPLYRIQKGKDFHYAYTEAEKQKVLEKIQGKMMEKKEKPSKSKVRKLKLVEEGKNEATLAVEKEEFSESTHEELMKGISIQRYKGLGEMNPDQLWDTTMDPEKRVLKQVTIEDAEEADRLFDILMGKEVLPRKKFIQAYAQKVKNLDV